MIRLFFGLVACTWVFGLSNTSFSNTLSLCNLTHVNQDGLLCAFKKMAFNKSSWPNRVGWEDTDIIFKWENHIDISLTHDVNNLKWFKQVPNDLLKLLRKTKSLTGLSNKLQGEGFEGAEIDAWIVSRAFLKNVLLVELGFSKHFSAEVSGRTECVTIHNNKSALEGNYALIIVDSGLQPNALIHCFFINFVRALGLPAFRQSQDLDNKIDSRTFKELTTVDKFLIRTLYDPRIKANMPKDEAMAQAKIIIPELIKAYKERGISALYQ